MPGVGNRNLNMNSYNSRLSALPSVYNWGLLSRFQRARHRVYKNEADCDIVFIADSTGAGYGANTASSYTGASAKAIPAVLASLMAGANMPASRCPWWGTQNVYLNSSTLPLYDPRISGMTGWSQATGSAWGGSSINSNGTTNPLYFTPGVEFDTFDVYFNSLTSGVGIGNVTVDGVSVGSFNCVQATARVYKATFSAPPGATRIEITPASSSTIYVLGIVPGNTARRQFRVHNASWAGAKASDLVGASNYRIDDTLMVFKPALTFVIIGENEMLSSVAAATYKANMITLIDQIQARSDVVLVTPIQIQGATSPTWDEINQTVNDLASPSMPVLNLGEFIGPYAAGHMSDANHLNEAGYETAANFIFDFLRAI